MYTYREASLSRGPGRLQVDLFVVLQHRRKPMTFADIRKVFFADQSMWAPYRERSLRRVLRRLVYDQVVWALDGGGPRSPHRYCVNPIVLAMAGPEGEYEAYWKELEPEREAHPGSIPLSDSN